MDKQAGYEQVYGALHERSRVTQAWLQVVFDELSTLTSLALITVFLQYGIFFALMFGTPGIRDYAAPFCDSLYYISDKLASDKGTASAMALSSVLSWVLLTSISCQEHFLLNRNVINLYAVAGFTGMVCVVLFNNTSDDGDLHLAGAALLSASYLLAQCSLVIYAFYQPTVSNTARYVALGFTALSVLAGLTYLFTYVLSSCRSAAVIVEYILYLLTSVTNLVVYIDFTASHTSLKIIEQSEQRMQVI
eukprot:764581-Hanusia_phi.AAC.14